ncbi:hypothetical protein N7474_000089 [Penicillium riverlandense]|uniref:uncharacterized protein n=1 Tax=Penicillium riverlandense TaxID=1903569 RepID=UPI0025472B3E|nr:uncharacterized protein N7474_000089 [Penicillium riverlandense]KAJ5831778.1 hypothetical protein N7474_000089 [Penicillium riverlandense]
MENPPGTGTLDHGPPHASSPSDSLSAPSQQTTTSLAQKRSSLPPAARGNSGARHAKRLTLNFPVNLSLHTPDSLSTSEPVSASPGAMTPITQPSTRPSPALTPGTPLPFDTQADGYDFLRAIASQERRVLELREELQRAEAELVTLKKQWALSEKSRKQTEISYHAEQMKPLKSPDSVGPDGPGTEEQKDHHRRDQSLSSVGSSAVSQDRLSRDFSRRNSIRATTAASNATGTNGTKISANGRRVFQGSHTRTLSLLSPVTAPSTPPRAESSPSESERVGRTPRSATLPSVERSNTSAVVHPGEESQIPEHLLAQWRKQMPPASREAFLRTGKQMATDLREGLWTFLEDIRQATVGEEGINATQSQRLSPNNARKRDSTAKSKSRSRDRLSEAARSSSSSTGRGPGTETTISGKDTKPADISKSFWNEFGVDTPQKSPNSARRAPSDTNHAQTSAATANEQPPPPERLDSKPDEKMEGSNEDTADNWDVWDTPQKMTHTPSSSRSTVESSKHEQSPMTQGSSPRTSASFGDWNPSSVAAAATTAPDPHSVTEGIPWPALNKLTPSKLQRTASTLMAEWERSLSPSPERKSSSSSNKNNKKD